MVKQRLTTVNVSKNGEKAWINVAMGRIVNSNGQEVIQAVFTDITEQMQIEKAQERERILENRSLRAAIYTAYPLIISINLTKDSYNCFVDGQNFYVFSKEGKFTSFIEQCADSTYPSYQEEFVSKFSQEALLQQFAKGEREVYMELKTKDLRGIYHWVSVHVIYVENPFSDDVLAISLVKILDSQRQEQAKTGAAAQGRTGICKGGKPGQIRFPPHEPRHQDSDERHHRHERHRTAKSDRFRNRKGVFS